MIQDRGPIMTTNALGGDELAEALLRAGGRGYTTEAAVQGDAHLT